MAEEEKPQKELSHGERLMKLRERVKLSQYDLGELGGISWRMIYYYEKERRIVSPLSQKIIFLFRAPFSK